jgi:TfoX/Sxy family transcriptional regulator of competence genes
MAHNEQLLNRVRAMLSHLPDVEEKKMFRGIVLMVNGKMCLSVGRDELMCRIHPEIHQQLLETKNCRTMIMGKKECIGYIMIDVQEVKTKKELAYWVNLALEYNTVAKASRKKTAPSQPPVRKRPAP